MTCGLGFYQYIFGLVVIASVVFLGFIAINLGFKGYKTAVILPSAVMFFVLFGYFVFAFQNNATKWIERIDPACSLVVPRL